MAVVASLPSTVIPGASFTGLAIGNTSTGSAQLYAADQNNGNVYIFNNKWQLTGTITDPIGLPVISSRNVLSCTTSSFDLKAFPSLDSHLATEAGSETTSSCCIVASSSALPHAGIEANDKATITASRFLRIEKYPPQ